MTEAPEPTSEQRPEATPAENAEPAASPPILRMTFNLTPRTAADLAAAAAKIGLNKTDTINRAIALLWAFYTLAPDGRARVTGSDGRTTDLWIL